MMLKSNCGRLTPQTADELVTALFELNLDPKDLRAEIAFTEFEEFEPLNGRGGDIVDERPNEVVATVVGFATKRGYKEALVQAGIQKWEDFALGS